MSGSGNGRVGALGTVAVTVCGLEAKESFDGCGRAVTFTVRFALFTGTNGESLGSPSCGWSRIEAPNRRILVSTPAAATTTTRKVFQTAPARERTSLQKVWKSLPASRKIANTPAAKSASPAPNGPRIRVARAATELPSAPPASSVFERAPSWRRPTTAIEKANPPR
jgi:hypothetical protein